MGNNMINRKEREGCDRKVSEMWGPLKSELHHTYNNT